MADNRRALAEQKFRAQVHEEPAAEPSAENGGAKRQHEEPVMLKTDDKNNQPRKIPRCNPSQSSSMRALPGSAWILHLVSQIFGKTSCKSKSIFTPVADAVRTRVDGIIQDVRMHCKTSPGNS